jgi:hypothetical protein
MARVDEFISGENKSHVFRGKDNDDADGEDREICYVDQDDGHLEVDFCSIHKDSVPALIKWLIEWYT